MTTKEFIDIIDNYSLLDINDPRTDESYLYELTDKLDGNKDAILCIEPILRLIEKYPTADFGSPGPLVHTVERFRGQYELKLLDSLDRRPTPLTIWMLNRVINGETNEARQRTLIKRLDGITRDLNVDDEVRKNAMEFLRFQSKRRQ